MSSFLKRKKKRIIQVELHSDVLQGHPKWDPNPLSTVNDFVGDEVFCPDRCWLQLIWKTLLTSGTTKLSRVQTRFTSAAELSKAFFHRKPLVWVIPLCNVQGCTRGPRISTMLKIRRVVVMVTNTQTAASPPQRAGHQIFHRFVKKKKYLSSKHLPHPLRLFRPEMMHAVHRVQYEEFRC